MMKRAMVDDAEWELLFTAMNGYGYSDALAAGCELGLFTYLHRHPGSTLDGAATGLGLPRHALRSLLVACASCRLINRDAAGGYTNSSVADKLLVEGTPESFLAFVKYMHVMQKPGNWHLAEAVRQGKNVGLDAIVGPGSGTFYERLQPHPQLERLFHEGMGAYSRIAPRVLDLPELLGIRRLLDVGGGDGTVAIALAERAPQLECTLLDKPSVCEIAQQRVAGAGLSGRIRCVGCDMFTDPWPAGHDGVLFSHVVEIFALERVLHLYRSAHAALPPGGRCVVWTVVCNDDETGPLQGAKSSLYFLTVASGEGMAYPVREHVSLLKSAGFREVDTHRYPTFGHAAVVATR
jgi:SAM-dependent methyltransferase